MKRSKLLNIHPPVWIIFYLVLALILHFLWFKEFVVFSNFWVGLIILVLGIFVMMSGWWLFQQEKTEVEPLSKKNSKLVTSGPFNFTRNPMYLGMVLILLGIAFFIGTLPMFLAPLAHLLTLNSTFIPFEKEKMERQFGKEYLTYKSKVRRWL